MPVVVQCQCGMRYQAPDHLVGSSLPCPSCGASIPVGQTRAARPATNANSGQSVVVNCRCGQRFMAPPNLSGQTLPCPACRTPLQIPFSPNDPLSGLNQPLGGGPFAAADPLQNYPASPQYNAGFGAQMPPYQGAKSPPASFSLSPTMIRNLLLAGGGIVVLIVLLLLVPPIIRTVRSGMAMAQTNLNSTSVRDAIAPGAQANPANNMATTNTPIPPIQNPVPQVPPAVPQPAVPQPAVPQPPAPQPPVAQPPAPQPAPAAVPPANASNNVPPAEEASGDPQFVDIGEQFLPAHGAPEGTPLRPQNNLAIYKLSNLRVQNNVRGAFLIVHYERVSGQERGLGPMMIIRTASGLEAKVPEIFGMPGQTKIPQGDVSVRFPFANSGPRATGLPKDLEVYFRQTENRFGDEEPRMTYKVSNSTVMGNMPNTRLAREWTDAEVDKVKNAPVEVLPGKNLDVGEQTEFVGKQNSGYPSRRYVEPKKRPLLGINYGLAENKVEKGKGKGTSIVSVIYPCFDPPKYQTKWEKAVAKQGYAVGGVNFKVKEKILAMQLVYMKLKPDGTLDVNDTYTSKWCGDPSPVKETETISGEGRKVIGFNIKYNGDIEAMALLLE